MVSEHVDGNDGYEGEDKKISEGCGLATLEIAEKPSDGEGNDKRPMGCHDVNLVESEAQTHMQQHVEHEDGKEQLLKTLLASHKGADNKHYYYAGPDGKLQTGWKNVGTKKYYFDKKTYAAKTGLQTIGKNKFFFSSNGVMRVKWVTIDGKPYYFSKVNGKLLTRYWLKYNNKWYRLDRNGTPLVDCERKIGKKWYTFNKKGVCTNK